ncbi:MAG: Hpt domain-containing protein [Rhizomicrobium sp.]
MSSASQTPIDLAQLALYTGGEAELDREVLDLFRCQSALAIRRLETSLASSNSKDWRETAHSLKGSALSIGATSLAEAAARAEGIDPLATPAEAAEALRELTAHSRIVAAFIETYLVR